MTNPTSNFGWQMPESTDLVTNLPADFEVFGQAVDTDFADLLGGTTGQILTKTSNTDLDFTWSAAAPGDITGVTAGTGISGGGTSGDVTVTNSMATAIDAKGDLIAGTGADAFSRLAVGTNNYVLTADSAEATGIKWAALPAATPSFVGCVLVDSTTQSIPNNTTTAITWDSEQLDTNGFHSTVTNTSRITIPSGKAGKYLIIGQISWDANTTGYRNTHLDLNGVNVRINAMQAVANYPSQQIQSAILNLTVGDYLEMATEQNSGGARDIYKGTSSIYGSFSVQYLGA
jgi:hypothetical protein